MLQSCDIAIVGGGFSGLATLANIVRGAIAPLSVALISRTPPDVFGPAYSTPRPEHLLNVRASAMGLFAGDHNGFFAWAQAQDKAVQPGDYLPRQLYGRYLHAVLDDTRALAAQKNVTLHFVRAEVEDITPEKDSLHLSFGSGGGLQTGRVVLAIGNALRAAPQLQDNGRVIRNPWAYDYAQATGKIGKIAVIGSGLTALDAIVSILNAGWKGQITCVSGNALFPQAHPAVYDAAKAAPAPYEAFAGKRLSDIMRLLRADAKARGADWPYAVDALRPHTQKLWRQLGDVDRKRLVEKYFTLWNVHRHRCAASIRAQADEAAAAGKLVMRKARCMGVKEHKDSVELDLQRPGLWSGSEHFDLAIQCTGVNYATAKNPLLTRLLHSGVLKDAGNPYGIAASENYEAYKGAGGVIYALGTPLFGQLFETTAVPELRAQADAIAKAIISARP